MISLSHLHPMLVHFPIALVSIGFIADLTSLFLKKEKCLSSTGFYLLFIGTISALTALLTGIFFTTEMEGAAGEIQETHELFAWISLCILTLTLLIRIYLKIQVNNNNALNRLVLVLYGLAFVSVSITGFFGGTLVYNYMMPI